MLELSLLPDRCLGYSPGQLKLRGSLLLDFSCGMLLELSRGLTLELCRGLLLEMRDSPPTGLGDCRLPGQWGSLLL